MAKRIFTAHKVLKFLLNESGHSPSHAELDLMLNVASQALFREKTGNTQEYQNGRPVPREGVAMTTPITEALRPFRRQQQYSTDAALVGAGTALAITNTGVIVLPPDLAYTSVLDIDSPEAEESADFVSDEKARMRLKSIITGPTVARPIAVEMPPASDTEPARLRIYPAPKAATYTYLTLPADVHYDVTYNLDGSETYNDGPSKDIPWRPSQDNELYMRALEPLGLNNRDQLALAFARTATERGM